MQGTVVMLMALSGLGCHHKACDTVYAPSACYSSCYSSGCFGGCYSSSCFSGCYGGDIIGSCYTSGYGSCYSGGLSSCYSDSFGGCYSSADYGGCYGGHGGWKKGCCIGRLFSGLFHGHKWHRYRGYNAYASDEYVASAPFYSGYSGMPVFGANVPTYTSSQAPVEPTPVAPSIAPDSATPPPPAPAAPATPNGEGLAPAPASPVPAPPAAPAVPSIPAKPKV